MKEYIISGIQQIGIGVSDVYESWEWYRKNLGMDLAVFDEAAEANLMLPYTGGDKQARHAVLALNYQGGSGLEIWQYTSRVPVKADFAIKHGDLGILGVKYKSKDVAKTRHRLKREEIDIVSDTSDSPRGNSFLGKDPWGNLFEVVSADDWFVNPKTNGGVYGCIIGVSDIDRSMEFYKDLLGYNKVIYDGTGAFSDLEKLDKDKQEYRRVILTHSAKRDGAFAPLFGPSEIELVQVTTREPKKIYKDRFWGDLGYIHLCFDIQRMDSLKEKAESIGHPFTVDSAESFDMGEAAGRFTYLEDPDGTLIEFVETHKVPIMKKLSWYLDLTKRNHKKPLPRYLLKAMFMNRTKHPIWPR